MTGPDRSPLRVLRRALTDVVALAYLGLCAALLIWAVVVTALDDSGESMAGVIPIFATAPTSLIFLVLPDHVWAFFAAVVLAALVNAAVIGWCSRTLRARRRTG
ncbi:hypothetical protein ELQ87_08265 [Streptomyces griseoviridis]|uniref:Uncharacterized protein n=2 Tax=Streptomyces TaxID=1883 RepID=A0A3S9Z928_STRGD|nr:MULTISPECIES: hypothetical protein [Streptomyces]AZS84278.1 hypothetical protein ELQ87_08265 [Streptomyces griseoviridis]MDH6699635.1 hypothetical protein [Streptomyces sp. MAA16]MDT0476450.1 hypothetical protein [Streptomyces sp. DSM 41014]QCN88863.1 hypothetical protein DDJ31_31070 [Streptomyces griseoviridis]